MRSKILRQVVQKIEVRLTPCRDFFGQADGIIFKQGVRHELCGVAFIVAYKKRGGQVTVKKLKIGLAFFKT